MIFHFIDGMYLIEIRCMVHTKTLNNTDFCIAIMKVGNT